MKLSVGCRANSGGRTRIIWAAVRNPPDVMWLNVNGAGFTLEGCRSIALNLGPICVPQPMLALIAAKRGIASRCGHFESEVAQNLRSSLLATKKLRWFQRCVTRRNFSVRCAEYRLRVILSAVMDKKITLRSSEAIGFQKWFSPELIEFFDRSDHSAIAYFRNSHGGLQLPMIVI